MVVKIEKEEEMNAELILKKLYENLEYDGYGYWLPERCIGEDTEDKPTWEEFINKLESYE